ncbi:SUMF1/EgtB/PvdO family nonheme iron enzyme [Verrucomicrobium sp. BvORR034]|uniref:formylglycine-generating enzyme family protein n=1 Tax=Verrucomicrobium sp. BvORR034 TaxID=1396418 RepID=UPI0009DE9EC6|nr:SUMF1/EgtB/PvdO family nonheme iron enzyme [Verrucomicrobium sp. BvORR034]
MSVFSNYLPPAFRHLLLGGAATIVVGGWGGASVWAQDQGQTGAEVAPAAAAPAGKYLPGSLDEPVQVLLKNSLGMSFSTMPGSPVLFARWETRVSDFEAFLKATGRVWNHPPSFTQTGDHPVVNVTLQEALAFCNWLTEKERTEGTLDANQSYRLPTTDEWTTAVGLAVGRVTDLAVSQRVTDKEAHPWGPEWPPPSDAGNYNSREINGSDDGFTHTAPVGSFRPSKEGLYDLGGNVWEWTWVNELTAQSYGVLRGGSWMYYRPETLLSSFEYKVSGELRAPSVGFRCVLEDKRRTSVFLTETDKANKAAAQARREQLTATPSVSAEDVKRRMAELAGRSPDGTVAGRQLPDAKSLKAATADKPYTNTLAMNLLPLDATGAGRKLLGETEVRVQDYELAMAQQGKSWTNKPPFAVRENYPIVNVTWSEAVDFCRWLTEHDRAAGLIPANAVYRLPTDAEWSEAVGLKDEKGATPAEKHLADKVYYPWGDSTTPPPYSVNLDTSRMQGYQDSHSYTSPVASFTGDAGRFKDLAGNVLEWCQDEWPGSTGERTLRGSSWLTSEQEALLSSYRSHLPADSVRPHVGFRVLLDLGSP